MMDRRRYHRAYPTLPVHHPAATTPETQSPEPDDAEIHTQIAEAVTQIDQPQIDQPSPISPQINLEPAPIKISNIHYADPNCANAQPNKADPLIAPAMIHAAPQHSSAPRPM
jgi:hypothetical protein